MQTQKKYIEFRQKRSFDQVLNTTFVFLKYNFKKFFQAYFVISGPIILLTGIAYGMFFFWIAGGSGVFGGLQPGSNMVYDDIAGFVGIGAVVFSIILFFGYVLMSGSVYEFMALYSERGGSESISPADVWARLKTDLGRLLKNSLLLMLLGLAAGAVVVAVMVLVFSMGSFFSGIGAALLIPIFAALGVFLFIRLIVAFPIIVFENAGASESLKRSFTLTSGAFWRTFGVVAMMLILQSIIGYVVLIPQLILSVGLAISTASGEIEDNTVLQVLTAISYGLYFIVSFGLSTLITVGIGLQYFSLKEEKDHSGLLSRIAEIGQSPSNLDSSLETY